jgi:hypothetical protein
MKIIATTITLILCPYFLFSQEHIMWPSYIINNNYDTIWGEGYMSPFQEFCIFKPNIIQVTSQYAPDEITCIRFIHGKNYVSKEIITKKTEFNIFKKDSFINKNERYFLEYLIDGKVDLFVLQQFSGKRFFIEKPGMPISELEFAETIIEENSKKYTYDNPRLKGMLYYYMSDSPSICEQIAKLNYISQSTLINLSEEYHYSVCPDKACINYTKKLFWKKSIIKE